MKIINIGVLAHVDAGKTTLTEQILYISGVKEEPGSVDLGSTTTDSLEVERRRGITVKSAAVSFFIGDLKVNLIDTPGHADFISEVEHSLSVLDGVILVISGVEGVQAQTRVLMQTLKELHIPTLLFMNKMDRTGADYRKVRTMIQMLLDEHICDLNEVVDEGSSSVQIKQADPAEIGWIETLATQNDELLRAYADDIRVPMEMLQEELCRQTKQGKAFPLFAGSAAKGIGINFLLGSLENFFPVIHPAKRTANPLSGKVFKVSRNATGERTVFIRLFEGTLRLRDEIPVLSSDGQSAILKVKHLQSLLDGKWISASSIEAGDIAILTGGDLNVGDVIGVASDKIKMFNFQKPPIQVKASAGRIEDEAILHNALTDLTVEDPFLQYFHDEQTQEKTVRVFGKIQQEILVETIKQQYGIEVNFSAPKVICLEKPFSTGENAEFIGEPNNPFYATVGFRIEPGMEGSGLQYRLEVELGSLPPAFQRAIKDTVAKVLQEGLYGWQVTDIIVTLTHTGYSSPVSTAKDFRSLVPLVLMKALLQAGTDIYEPVNITSLILPEPSLSKVLSLLSLLEAAFQEPKFQKNWVLVEGRIPVRTSDVLKSELHSLTSGEGFSSMKPGGYLKVKTVIPVNQRKQINPLIRGEYLLHLNKIL